LHPVLAPRRQCHRRAVIRERGGGGRADAARGPRHQGNGALQRWFHRELTFSRSSPSASVIPPARGEAAPGPAEPDSPSRGSNLLQPGIKQELPECTVVGG